MAPVVPSESLAASANGACDFCNYFVRKNAHDDGRAQHVDDGGESQPDEGRQRDIALRVFDDASGHRRAFDAHVGPQRHRGCTRHGVHVRLAGHVPAREECRRVEPDPAEQRDRHDRDQRERHCPGLESADDARAEDICERKKPDDGGRCNDARRRIRNRWNQLGQVADSGDGNCDVADPVAEPVHVVRLKAGVGAEEVAGIGIWTALLRIEFAKLCKHEAEGSDAHRRDQPAKDCNAADLCQVDGQQEEAGADHVACHKHRSLCQRHLAAGLAHLRFEPALRHCTYWTPSRFSMPCVSCPKPGNDLSQDASAFR